MAYKERMKEKAQQEFGKEQNERYELNDAPWWSTAWNEYATMSFKIKPQIRDQLYQTQYSHNIKKQQFFLAISLAIINNDPDIMPFLTKLKKINTVMPKSMMNKQEKTIREQKEIALEFNQEVLTDKEIESIFDVLEFELAK